MSGTSETLVSQAIERRKERLAAGMPLEQVTELWLKESQDALQALTSEALDMGRMAQRERRIP
jgi:hypothetical protein